MDEKGRLGNHQQAGDPPSVRQQCLFEHQEPEWIEVDLRRVAVERSRRFGGVWLGLELCRLLELSDFLQCTIPSGREGVAWAVTSLVLVLGRHCDPSSELHLAEQFYESSALSDLLGIHADKVNDDRLYRALDRLLPHEKALEQHLKQRLGELFDLDSGLLRYDVTSTYSEGAAEGNEPAQRGYSRDHRPDCKQVHVALVVSRCGMPLGYEVFAGNRADVTTVEQVVEHVESLFGKAHRIRVMDRGMVSEDLVPGAASGKPRAFWTFRQSPLLQWTRASVQSQPSFPLGNLSLMP